MDDALTARYKELVRTLPADAAGLHALGLALRQDFNCDRATLFLKARHGVYIAVYAEGLEDMTLAVKPGEGLAGKAVQRRAAILSNEAPYDPNALSRLRDHYSGYETQSVMVAPIPRLLLSPEGAVQLINKLIGPFTDADIARLGAVAKGLRGLRRFCREPAENLWDSRLHRESIDGPAPPDQAVLADHRKG
ncbi:MAG: GAF domain-containing protein [Bacteroidales bacterium]|nr:GAF domain-containing protein [Bacteroidales bacterium]